MAQVITYTRPDGSVIVVTPSRLPFPLGDPPLKGESEEQYLDRIALHASTEPNFDATATRGPNVDAEEIGAIGKRWRKAWRLDDKGIVVDLDEAKKVRAAELHAEVHGFEFRGKRFPGLLDTLAAEYQKAIMLGDEPAATAIQTKAQAVAALDKASIEAAVADVADLDALAKHEPTAIKNAKPTKLVNDETIEEVAVKPR